MVSFRRATQPEMIPTNKTEDGSPSLTSAGSHTLAIFFIKFEIGEPPGHYAPHHRICAVLVRIVRAECLVPFFSLLPPGLAALLQSVFFFAGALFFARMTLFRSVFHGFQI